MALLAVIPLAAAIPVADPRGGDETKCDSAGMWFRRRHTVVRVSGAPSDSFEVQPGCLSWSSMCGHDQDRDVVRVKGQPGRRRWRKPDLNRAAWSGGFDERSSSV